MTMKRVLSFAVVVCGLAIAIVAALGATQAPPAHHAHAHASAKHHHPHVVRGAWHRGTSALPVFRFEGGCTDIGSPYWPCQ